MTWILLAFTSRIHSLAIADVHIPISNNFGGVKQLSSTPPPAQRRNRVVPPSGADGGRISEDGPGQNNPDRNEDPWGRAGTPLEPRCSDVPRPSTQNEEQDEAGQGTKDGSKPHDAKTS
jgi:hypothetical protein